MVTDGDAILVIRQVKVYHKMLFTLLGIVPEF